MFIDVIDVDTSQQILHKIKASLGMLAGLLWGRGDLLGSMDGKHGGVYVEYVQGLTNEFAR